MVPVALIHLYDPPIPGVEPRPFFASDEHVGIVVEADVLSDGPMRLEFEYRSDGGG